MIKYLLTNYSNLFDKLDENVFRYFITTMWDDAEDYLDLFELLD
jgi:hypothetical protein